MEPATPPPAARTGPPPPGAVNLWAEHPLLMFAWARRIPRSVPRDLLYTLIFNTMLAGAFTLLGLLLSSVDAWRQILVANLVIANAIGFLIHLEFDLAERLVGDRYRGWPFWGRAALFTGLPIAGVIGGYWIGFEILDWQRARDRLFTPGGITALVALSVLISGIVGLILSARERAAKAQAAFEAERARVALAERAAALAQLKALEAQVEPHFLYNTLAHVLTLVDREPATARRMIERLIVLLRSSAAIAAGGASTLGEQVAHARAYLDLVALRMGPRLAWSVDVPPSLAALAVPPALLQPLVENAIKHGIEPKVEGGRVAIAARDDGGRLVVEVADTGAGFGATTAPLGGSSGIGLANLRARLAALYGNDASLAIAEGAEGGVRVTVALPAEARHG